MLEQPETLPRHALAPEPLTRFITNPVTRETLKNILREPAFISAMNFLQEQDRLRPEQLDSLPDIIVVRKAAYHASTSSIYERLQNLTKVHEPIPTTEGWDHLTNQ